MHSVFQTAALVSLTAVLGAATVTAEDAPRISGERDLVCASQDVMACTDGPTCMQASTSTFDLPDFMFIHVKERDIRAVDADGSSLTSEIKMWEATDRSAILQGFENHRGWTIAIDRMDGSFTLSSTGPDVNFMIMGACTSL